MLFHCLGRVQRAVFLTIALATTSGFDALAADQAGASVVYDAELTDFDYPFAVSEFVLNSQRQSLVMRYMDVKPEAGATGKVAVLLHGKNFAGFYWREVAQDLLRSGYRVVIPDQIGFGKSSKPENYQYSFAQLALNTQNLLSAIGVMEYVLVGHSMGGMLATTMALDYPDKVSKLVLINPIGLEPYLSYVEIKDPQFFFVQEMAKTPDKIRDYQRKNYYDGEWKPAYEALIQPHLGWLNSKDKARVAWNNALTYMPIFAEDITARFSQLRTPTRLIIGTRDRTGPGRGWKKPGVTYQLGLYQQLGKAAAEAIPNAQLYELEGLGHMPQIEDFARFQPVFAKAMSR